MEFNKVGDFLSPKEHAKDTRAERRKHARAAYKLAKKMRRDLAQQVEQTKNENS
jgi:hypothetical protein